MQPQPVPSPDDAEDRKKPVALLARHATGTNQKKKGKYIIAYT